MCGLCREGLRKHPCTVSHLEQRKEVYRTSLVKENMKETKQGVELKPDLPIPPG